MLTSKYFNRLRTEEIRNNATPLQRKPRYEGHVNCWDYFFYLYSTKEMKIKATVTIR